MLDSAALEQLEVLLSLDRLGSYLKACHQDHQQAMELYLWNSHASAAFYLALQAIEVVVRNVSHRQLCLLYGQEWFADEKFLSLHVKIRIQIDNAVKDLRSRKYPVDMPHMIPTLSFGFWTMLYAPKYESTLWSPKDGLRRAFPRTRIMSGILPRREIIAQRLHHLRIFRNRVAHHEPIFQRNLVADYIALKEVGSWMHELLPQWLDEISRCDAVLLQRPLNVGR